MIKNLIALLLVIVAHTAIAQSTDTSTAKPMSWKDVSGWRSISTFSVTISPDGKWVAYPLLTREGDGELIVKKVKDTVLRKYPIGSASFAGFAFSDDGKWLAYKEYTKFKEAKAAAKIPGKQLFEKLVLVDLATNKKTEFEKTGNFLFNGKQSSYLAISLAKDRAGAKADDPKSNDLLLVELSTGKTQNIGNAGEFSFNKEGNLLAYTIDAANKTGNGLYLLNMLNHQTTVLDNDRSLYKSLGWNEEGTAFALLKMTKDEKYKVDKGVVIGVKNAATAPDVVIYDPLKDSVSFPANLTISTNRRPVWSDDLSRLFFGLNELVPVKKPDPRDTSANAKATAKTPDAQTLDRIKADTSIKTIDDLKRTLAKMDSAKLKPGAKPLAVTADDVTKPDMIIWHWQDKRLQSRQQVMEMQDKNFSYLAMYDLPGKKFMRLNDSTLLNVVILPKQQYALATDMRSYELESNLDGQSYADYYIIDLKTGDKTLFAEKFYQTSFSLRPDFSPDGLKMAYGKDGNYYVYDIPSKTSVNITEKVPTSFIDSDDDHNVTKPLTPIQDWSSDSKYIIIRDKWDFWQVPVNGKDAAVNLTVDGAAQKIKYTGRFVTDPNEKGIDLKKPMYLRKYGEWTKKSGIAVIQPGKKGFQPGAQTLIWEDASVGNLQKAKNSNAFMYAKETFSRAPEFFVANEKLQDAEQETANTPDRAKYTWSPGVQLVNYVSDKGDSLQGALFLPAGYEKGKKYPTIVYYYEKMSQTLNVYSNPDFPGGGWNPAMYTSNGYAVFMPDIVYKMDDPGMSAVWCVLPGVKAAIQTGVIDEKNIGIQGHSWGGYQTAFLVTQTNMFKAAAPGAALTNMISMYDLIYWNSGGGNMSIFEASQGRFKGAPWENWDSYLRNSPIYYVKKVTTPILMLHNDKDGAVDFTQGIEFYNALRRLNKPVVMITYKGENHGISKLENRKDYAVRMMEFFDHHLKGKPAPDWLESGIDRLKLEEHLEKRAF